MLTKSAFADALIDALVKANEAETAKENVLSMIDQVAHLTDGKREDVSRSVQGFLESACAGGEITKGSVGCAKDIADVTFDEFNAALEKEFRAQYGRLYDARDNVPGFREAYDSACSYVEENGDVLRSFENYIEDIIMSDREIAAFGFAIESILKEKGNTKFSYFYRDADNYKQFDGNEVIVKGWITAEEMDTILCSLQDGELFIPRQVGLPETRLQYPYDEQSDHCFFEVWGDNPFERTGKAPTIDMTASELAEAFANVKAWDDFSYEKGHHKSQGCQ